MVERIKTQFTAVGHGFIIALLHPKKIFLFRSFFFFLLLFSCSFVCFFFCFLQWSLPAFNLFHLKVLSPVVVPGSPCFAFPHSYVVEASQSFSVESVLFQVIILSTFHFNDVVITGLLNVVYCEWYSWCFIFDHYECRDSFQENGKRMWTSVLNFFCFYLYETDVEIHLRKMWNKSQHSFKKKTKKKIMK